MYAVVFRVGNCPHISTWKSQIGGPLMSDREKDVILRSGGRQIIIDTYEAQFFVIHISEDQPTNILIKILTGCNLISITGKWRPPLRWRTDRRRRRCLYKTRHGVLLHK